MNAKRCKQLRKIVSRLSHFPDETTYRKHKQTGVISVTPKCKRGAYLMMKKQTRVTIREMNSAHA